MDKVVFLNCDDENSNFWKYFCNNFKAIGLKKVYALHLGETNTTYVLSTVDGNNIEKNVYYESGDFRSPLSQSILQKSDIVITNPPFSLFRELVVLLYQNNKEFILIGNQNAFSAKEIFPLFKEEKIFTGFNKVKEFLTPDGSSQFFGNICWFTNLPIENEKPLIHLYSKYNELDYPQYDNFKAINVDKVKDIPYDYYETMGVPISYLEVHNPELFEIKGLAAGNTKIHKLNYDVDYTPNILDRGGCGVVKGTRKYTRIFIKRKKNEST